MNKYVFKTYQSIRFLYKNFPISPLRLLKRLRKSEYWNRDQMESFQLEKLNKLISDVKASTVYFNERAAEINDPYRTIEEFKNEFPIMTKDDIRGHENKLINTNLKVTHTHSTSGSTGTPIVAKISCLAQSYRLAGIMRFYSWWGIEQNDKNALVWGFKETKKAKSGVFFKIKKKFKNRLDLNVFDLNDETIFQFYNRIEQFIPAYIRGYTSGLYLLAELMEKHNLRFKKVNLKVAIVTGEILYPYQRDLIEMVFECKVANEYGSGECGLYAHECPEGSMHINEESVLLTTDENNNAIVTEIHNNGMPLINYVNTDKIQISNGYCKCGRTSRLIEKIDGRATDFILTADGSKKSDALFYYIIAELDDIDLAESVKQFKIIQKNNHFLFQIVKDENYNERVASYIENRMREEIGQDILINIQTVEEIKRDDSGKLRMFVREN